MNAIADHVDRYWAGSWFYLTQPDKAGNANLAWRRVSVGRSGIPIYFKAIASPSRRNRNAGTVVQHPVMVAAGMACVRLNRLLQPGLAGIPCQARQPGPTVRAAGLAAAGNRSFHRRTFW